LRASELGLLSESTSSTTTSNTRTLLNGLRPLVRRSSGYKKIAKGLKRLSNGNLATPLPANNGKLGSLPEASMSAASFFHFPAEQDARFSMDFADLEPPTPLQKQAATFSTPAPEPLLFFDDDQLIQAAVEQLAHTSSSSGSAAVEREKEMSAVDELYPLLQVDGNNECVECRAPNPK
jgi:hypothetical protein